MYINIFLWSLKCVSNNPIMKSFIRINSIVDKVNILTRFFKDIFIKTGKN